MEAANDRKKVTFRLDANLVERLKEMAKRQNCSMNELVECVLFDVAYTEPNEVTKAAIEDARCGRSAGTIDASSLECLLKSMNL